jgi:peptidyl-prolyl cis-trans isomerase SurA
MKKNLLFLFYSFIIITNAQAQKVVADKVIAVVGDKVVLKSDIDNSLIDMQRQGVAIPPNARCMTLEQAMGVKALVLQAEKDSLPVTDDEVDADIDNQIRYFINMYGSKEELEKIAGKSVYQMKEDYRQAFRERKLAAAMRDKIVGDIHITPNEVKDYFDKIRTDSLPFYESQLQIGEIIIYPKANRDAEEYAVDQLKEFKTEIENGSKKFEILASLYSDDPGSKTTGGEYQINKNEKQWDNVFLTKAFSLKEGQISNPFKTKFGYHIIQMESRNGDDALIRHILIIPQITPVEIAEAKAKLDSIQKELVAGTLQFGDAVSRYSDDESSKFTGGNMMNKEGSTFLTIDQLDKEVVLNLKNLKPGGYSEPMQFTDERGKMGVRVIYLKSKSEPHRENLKDDYSRIANSALEDKKSDALDKWFNQNIPNYYIMVDDEDKGCPEMQKWLAKKH